jgi:hypothetical protein
MIAGQRIPEGRIERCRRGRLRGVGTRPQVRLHQNAETAGF